MNIEEINKEISNLKDKSDISDGSHTYGELYEDRMFLFSIICNDNQDKAWKSWLHDDGTMFDDYFIVGIDTPEGSFTYHYHKDTWDNFKVPEIPKAPAWDGHSRKDIDRLLSLYEQGNSQNAITIPITQYRHLLIHAEKFDYLYGCGVDNWSGWDDTMEKYYESKMKE